MILLDTHVLLWMALSPPHLSQPAAKAIQEARRKGALCIADISLWEIALLARRKKIQMGGTLDAFLYEISRPLLVKPTTPAIASMSSRLPEDYPEDPADRLIGSTSIVEGLPLVTADRELQRCGLLNTIW
jgi:PIN domain nuclease of toxin-antitoxin system